MNFIQRERAAIRQTPPLCWIALAAWIGFGTLFVEGMLG